MMTPKLKRLIRPAVIVEYAVWAVITGSVLFYFVLAYVLERGGVSAGSGLTDNMRTVFYAAGALVAAASVLYRRYCFSDTHVLAVIRNDADVQALPDGLWSEHADSGRAALLQTLREDELRAVSLMNELLKASIISLVLNEMVVMLGFVLAFLSGDFMKIIPFGIASLVLNIWMFPRPESVAERACGLYSS
jgi:hypothetical protein